MRLLSGLIFLALIGSTPVYADDSQENPKASKTNPSTADVPVNTGHVTSKTKSVTTADVEPHKPPRKSVKKKVKEAAHPSLPN